MSRIHPTAVIDGDARLADDVEVGPYAVIRGKVALGEGTVVGPACLLTGPAKIGRRNVFYGHASIGGDSQDKKGQDGVLEMGDGNLVREFATISRASARGERTLVGSDNWIMAYSHIAHDCRIGDKTVIANLTQLGGHVTVEDGAILGGGTLIHQFCRIGRGAIVGGDSGLRNDLPPFAKYAEKQNLVSVLLNKTGIERAGLADELPQLTKAYVELYRKGQTLPDAIKAIRLLAKDSPSVTALLEFLEAPSRFGIVYPRRYGGAA
ncbi:MAG: acyl-ACP--UDP-N-acetylglucosamine O-acyltransferase [Betaproteobacteria bacterium AqS2]|uniref:Acyl-ACP--UDP-N-acetylglucosamine O-acyltransferase n=1 Tax=Candidatus Amphirhobacter heronislandensis TaxID=1732024 RepID=A0A930UCJ3_9GAMM|nr:acyl-ACP--UDP-N-acetylglucosamine O-acyltransferase [Betaproteobacteria bacterium AqS2]